MSKIYRLEQVTEKYKDKYPHIKSYAECISRTYLSGLAATFLKYTRSILFYNVTSAAFSGTYIAVSLLKNKLPSSRPGHLNVIAGGLLGSLVGFQVVYTRTKACNNGWMAAEDRSTYLSPLEERQADARSQQSEPGATHQ